MSSFDYCWVVFDLLLYFMCSPAVQKTPRVFSPSRRRRWRFIRIRTGRWVWRASWPWDHPTRGWPWCVWPSIWWDKAATPLPWMSLVNKCFRRFFSKIQADLPGVLIMWVCFCLRSALHQRYVWIYSRDGGSSASAHLHDLQVQTGDMITAASKLKSAWSAKTYSNDTHFLFFTLATCQNSAAGASFIKRAYSQIWS